MQLDEARKILVTHSHSKLNGSFPTVITHTHELTNPICGDFVKIQLHIHKDKIQEIGFLTKSCAICTASASMMCEEIRERSPNRALEFSRIFEDEILSLPEKKWPDFLISLRSFEHLKVNPSRRACALLPWIALRSALKEISHESTSNGMDGNFSRASESGPG